MKKQLHSRCLDLDTGHPWSIPLQILRGQIDARFIRRHDTLVVLFLIVEHRNLRVSKVLMSKVKGRRNGYFEDAASSCSTSSPTSSCRARPAAAECCSAKIPISLRLRYIEDHRCDGILTIANCDPVAVARAGGKFAKRVKLACYGGRRARWP